MLQPIELILPTGLFKGIDDSVPVWLERRLFVPIDITCYAMQVFCTTGPNGDDALFNLYNSVAGGYGMLEDADRPTILDGNSDSTLTIFGTPKSFQKDSVLGIYLQTVGTSTPIGGSTRIVLYAASRDAAYATNDQEVTSTTLASSSDVVIQVQAGWTYQLVADLKVLNDGTAEGIKLALNGTATLDSLFAQIEIYDNTSGTMVKCGAVTAFDSTVGFTITNSGINYARIKAAFKVGSTGAGTVLVRFAQNATGASAGVHLQPGSTMVATPITLG